MDILGEVMTLTGLNFSGNPLRFPSKDITDRGVVEILKYLRAMLLSKSNNGFKSGEWILVKSIYTYIYKKFGKVFLFFCYCSIDLNGTNGNGLNSHTEIEDYSETGVGSIARPMSNTRRFGLDTK